MTGSQFEEVKAMCSLPPRCTSGCVMSAASPQNEVRGLLQSLGLDHLPRLCSLCIYKVLLKQGEINIEIKSHSVEVYFV